ncbi:permease for cytosine/purines, uracil, thiamine, allantoin-domain-containing protein [Ampelomyces quisqualis]|uniref:Permease for cytosine/purines, uracil, thiamine, allantoin-domain-containing protein n=1 Tax=Ampelomyces quisqualis TaxID=50730 RepID=A0A6A5QLB5_AMPQU|nr:permease for cytosine/purines, uracil, thiamine, allantoin-domain-containing protein [Ampelomyces quisqualis]
MDPAPQLPAVIEDGKNKFAPDTHTGPPLPVHGHEARQEDGTLLERTYSAWKSFESQLVAYNLEARGIQRVDSDERQNLRLLGYSQVAIMWFSVNLAANNITLGMLGPAVFALGFLDACLLSVSGAFVGSLVVAYIATFGPKGGNRTMIFSRYIMGWWPSKVVVILNIIVLLGYGMIDCVVAGQILSAVADGSMSIVVGIIVVAIISWLITTFGYQTFHCYERWAWLPQLIVLCILAGVAGPRFNVSAHSHVDENPDTTIGNRISFFGLSLAAAITYGGGAADYFVYYPEHASVFKIFGMTLTGLMCSFTFAFVVGIGLACGMATNPDWKAAYGVSQGALIVEAYKPLGGFGSFCGVVVALGLVANLIVPTYSSGIDAQILGRYAEAVPRVIWNTIGVVIYTVCALAGRAHLAEIFTNFLALMGYWVSVWIAITLEEHLVFRRKTGFNWEAWNQKTKLPLGIAAFVAFVIGWLGAILCMAQVWYLGPIAKQVGTYGADMGNYVGFAWAAIVYPPLRMWELKKYQLAFAFISSYASEDLIGLTNYSASAVASEMTSPPGSGSVRKAENVSSSRNAVQRDSFSDLVGAMRAKKPYSPVVVSSLRPSLSASTNSPLPSPVLQPSLGRSFLSPLAKSFTGRQSVAEYLQEQDMMSPTPSAPTVPGFMEKMERLEILTNRINNTEIDERAGPRLRTPSPAYVAARQSPSHLGPINPPTPAESGKYPVSKFDKVSAPMVRVTKAVWDTMEKDLNSLREQKRELEQDLAQARRDHRALLDEDHDVGAQIGKLRYQNEANRDQKAAMGRALGIKDVMIKRLQLDIDNLSMQVVELQAEVNRSAQIGGETEWLRNVLADKDAALREKNVACDRDAEKHAAAIHMLETTIDRLTIERDAAISDEKHAGDHAMRAQNLADTLAKREKIITELRQKNLDEQMRVTDLEDEVERLREEVNQESLQDLKEKLREKSAQCDRFRSQVKGTEQQLKVVQSRLMSALKGGEVLRGGAHLVAPNENSRLPRLVMSCSECYASNKPCDNGARCRNCQECNTTCARWRCSMKHKLGECQMIPCSLPHDPQGWLVMSVARPEW